MSWRLLAGAAAAQGFPPPPPPRDAIGVEGFAAGFNDKVVSGVPYSATITTETSQSLADGNQIQQTTTGSVARDGQGRTRREMTLKSIGPWAAAGNAPPHFVLINDVVAGASYALQPDKKTAQKLPQRLGRKKGKEMGMVTPHSDFSGDQKDVVSTPLGTQTVGGVLAEGTRFTRTLPVGAIGNEKPILIVTERWYSNDLQTVVMTKRSDPRMGETTFTLTNIQRSEPDPLLFQVPPDYTIVAGRPGARLSRSPAAAAVASRLAASFFVRFCTTPACGPDGHITTAGRKPPAAIAAEAADIIPVGNPRWP